VDIIIIGTHGRTGLNHTFFGSVAEMVIRHSAVPVFIIPCEKKTWPVRSDGKLFDKISTPM